MKDTGFINQRFVRWGVLLLALPRLLLAESAAPFDPTQAQSGSGTSITDPSQSQSTDSSGSGTGSGTGAGNQMISDPNQVYNQLLNQLTQTDTSSNNNSGSSSSGSPQIPAAPTISQQPVTPPQQPQQDRSNGNGAAMAAAIAGAAIAGVMCAKMLADAQKLEGEAKTNMEMMAMMECAQAAQQAASAAQNGKNKDQLTADSTPKQSELQAANPTTPSPAPKDQNLLGQAPDDSSPPDLSVPDTTPTPTPKLVAAAKPTAPLSEGEPLDDTSIPNAIPNANLKFDDTAKSGSTGGGPTGAGTLLTVA